MKNLLFIFLLLPSLAMVSPNVNGISQAISTGNADALAQYLDQSVEISILDDVDMYDKNEAVQMLRNFFAKNKPKSYNQMHQGTSKGQDSRYTIGNLVTSSNSFRVYIYLKVQGGQQLIQELRFDKE
ncbi:MAG: DUF4783 domain-containing protein [Bacteroidota bacterium]